MLWGAFLYMCKKEAIKIADELKGCNNVQQCIRIYKDMCIVHIRINNYYIQRMQEVILLHRIQRNIYSLLRVLCGCELNIACGLYAPMSWINGCGFQNNFLSCLVYRKIAPIYSTLDATYLIAIYLRFVFSRFLYNWF